MRFILDDGSQAQTVLQCSSATTRRPSTAVAERVEQALRAAGINHRRSGTKVGASAPTGQVPSSVWAVVFETAHRGIVAEIKGDA